MPRSRRLSRLGKEGPLLNLTPMVDVFLVLIIFFMLSTTLITIQSGLPVNLPQAQTSQVQSSDLPTVTVTEDKKIFVGGSEVTTADMVATLKGVLAQSSSKEVVLRADETVPYGFSVKVMDLIRQAGAQRIAIATGGR